MEELANSLSYRMHPKPISAVDDGGAPLGFLHERAKELMLRIISQLDTSLRHNTAVVCLDNYDTSQHQPLHRRVFSRRNPYIANHDTLTPITRSASFSILLIAAALAEVPPAGIVDLKGGRMISERY